VKNAIEALESGGEIVVTTTRGPGDTVVLTVVDDGPGLTRAGETVFDPWVSDKRGGTGLGLTLVRDLAAGRGGSVRHERGRGRGARFVVELPRLADARRAAGGKTEKGEARPRASSGVRRRPSSSMRAVSGGSRSRPIEIVLVDDDATLRGMLTTALELRGARVTTAGSMEGAVTLLETRAEPFDVALVDLGLPDGRGDQLARWLSERGRARQVVLTSGGPVSHAEAAYAAAVLRKPFAIDELVELADRLGRDAKARSR
jgi:CheY-like chemotaxis protein